MGYVARTISTTASLVAPTWWTGLADKTWAVICNGSGSGFDGGARLRDALASPTLPGGGNTISITAYSTAAVDQSRAEVTIIGGGHSDYAGNEAIGLALRTSQPGWSRWCEPSPGAYATNSLVKGGIGQYDADRGKNGWPASSHTYHRLVYANDRYWLPGLAGTFPSTAATSRIFWCDRLTRRWCAGGYWIDDADLSKYGATWMEEGGAVYVALDDAIYVEATGHIGYGTEVRVAKIDARTGAVLKRWTTSQMDGFCTGSVYSIPGTRYVVGRSHYGPGQLVVWNMATDPPARTNITPGGPAAGAGWADDRYGGAWHIATGGLVLGLGGGETFVKLVPNTPSAYTGAWTATLVSPTNVGSPSRVIPPSDSNVYGRYTIVDDMGDGRSALVYQPSNTSSPTYVMALPAAGL